MIKCKRCGNRDIITEFSTCCECGVLICPECGKLDCVECGNCDIEENEVCCQECCKQ